MTGVKVNNKKLSKLKDPESIKQFGEAFSQLFVPQSNDPWEEDVKKAQQNLKYSIQIGLSVVNMNPFATVNLITYIDFSACQWQWL